MHRGYGYIQGFPIIYIPMHSGSSQESVTWMVLSRIGGFAIFLIILAVLNLFSGLVTSGPIQMLTVFLNESVWLIFAMTIVFLMGEIFLTFSFPLNIGGAVFNAAGGVLLVMFLFRIFLLVDEMTGIGIFHAFEPFAPAIYILVFLVALVAGLVGIIWPDGGME
jgi:hypothetical protein